jgi:hypothetical protein
MENYELYIEPIRINVINGQFRKGHIPWNKGKKWYEWMDGRKQKRVLKYLEIGRKLGNKQLAGNNKIEVIGIKNGQLLSYKSATDAEKVFKFVGIKVNKRNINKVCHGLRKRAGGYQWFFASDVEKYKNLIP